MSTNVLARSSAFLLVFICLLLPYSTVNAQITGIITDVKETPLRGVHISVIGTDEGVYTNEDGIFQLNWKQFPVRVRFSAVGFRTQILDFKEPETGFSLALEEDLLGLGEVMVTVDRFYSPYNRERSIAKTTIDQQSIRKKITVGAVDLLRAEPGVFVQQTTVGQGSVYIRGNAGRDVLYLFNGLRMNPSFVRAGQNQYFGLIDPFLVSRMDVFRGPVSVYYGSDALSGGINVSTLTKDFTSTEVVEAEVLTSTNLGGTGEKTLNGQVSYQNTNLAMKFGATVRDFDFYNMPASTDSRLLFPFDESLDNADYNFYSFNYSAKVKITPVSNISVSSYFSTVPTAPRFDRMILGYSFEEGAGVQPGSAFESNSNPLSFSANSIGYEWLPKTKFVNQVQIKAGYYRVRDGRKATDFISGFEPVFDGASGEITNLIMKSDTSTVESNVSNQWLLALDAESILKDNLILKWGADFSYDYVSSRRSLETNFGEIDELLARYPGGSEYFSSGLFTHLDHQIGPRLNLEYGLRYSYIFVDLPFEGTASPRRFDPVTDAFDQLTTSFSAAYGLSRKSSLLLNFTNGFRAPNLSDLSEVGIRRSIQFQIPNTEISPERSFNLDLGIRHSGEIFSTELYGFWLHYYDRIRRVETGNIVNEEGRFIRPGNNPTGPNEFIEVTSLNEDASDVFGVEYMAVLLLNSSLETGLTFTYNYGVISTIDGGNEPVDRIPPANGLFYLDYDISKAIQVRPQVRYAFAQRRISMAEMSDNRVSPDGTDGFVNLQLVTNLELDENFEVKILADNLTNSSYREHASSLDGLRRNVSVTVSYRF